MYVERQSFMKYISFIYPLIGSGSKSGKRWNSRDLPNPVGKKLKRPDHSAKNRNIALVLVF